MTAYTTIYGSFLDKVNDYDLADMAAELAQTSMRGWLNQAVVRFLESCKKDLSQTEESGFTEDLDLMEIDILTEGMVEAWLKPIRNNLDLLRNTLSTKDFTTFLRQIYLIRSMILILWLMPTSYHVLKNIHLFATM